jgi:tripeptide aminopeptidase
MKTVKDLFLKYVTFDTRSDEASLSCPSTEGQRVFAEFLKAQLQEIGLTETSLDANGYLMATLPANIDNPQATSQHVPTIGFIAHLDTSPDMPGADVKAQTVDFHGGDIVLDAEHNIVLSSALYPELNDYAGQQLIVTDGSTLLGADDKAGIAAIVAAMQYLTDRPEIPHGKVRIAFTPDEEIGRGADRFDVPFFGCDFAFTIDGGALGELEYENFNAAVARVSVRGCNIHPGEAKGKMHNAIEEAIAYHNRLPTAQRPEKTSGYEGFFHLTSFNGTVEEAKLTYLVRDHSRELFEQKKQLLTATAAAVNNELGADIKVELRDQYYNMREKLEPRPEIIALAEEAMRACGVTPHIKPIRGGTDGSRLSFMGLPCPNIFTGGHNFHGRYEFLPVRSLEKCVDTIVQIVSRVCQTH